MKPSARRGPHAFLALSLAALAVAACETTGDPTQGGLVGWSEDKARQRQEQLRSEAEATREQASAQRQRADALKGQEQTLLMSVQVLERQLRLLVDENVSLESQLREQMARRDLKASEAERLAQVLQRSQETRARAIASTAAGAAGEPARKQQLDAIEQQNRLLHQEVMTLLKP